MMRKNMSLLTIDLRGNSGYDEFIHSRIVMKMAKNMRYLYQQYKKGEFTEEEFENFKEYIDPSFFDVDIPQEIVEFYNNNLPETSEENNEKENKNNEQIKENKIKMNNILEDEENIYDKDIWNCGVYYLKADRLKIAIKYEPQKIKLEEIKLKIKVKI